MAPIDSSPDATAGLESFLREVLVLRERIADPTVYPFNIPAVRTLERLPLHPHVTFFVGENGSGKSTVLEAIAVAAGFNPEGGTTNFKFTTRPSESDMHRCLRLVRGIRRPKTGYFLRAESFFNVASHIEALDREPVPAPPIINSYGGRSLHEQSHGESFLALVKHRFGKQGLYLLDEPEAALSPQRQLAFLTALHRLVREGSQFLIATHSPIILAYPNARILHLSEDGLVQVAYEQTDHFALTRDFLVSKDRYVARLLAAAETDGS